MAPAEQSRDHGLLAGPEILEAEDLAQHPARLKNGFPRRRRQLHRTARPMRPLMPVIRISWATLRHPSQTLISVLVPGHLLLASVDSLPMSDHSNSKPGPLQQGRGEGRGGAHHLIKVKPHDALHK